MTSFPTYSYYIRPDDLREDVIRKIATAEETRILLVFPARMRLHLRVLDLVLLRREAEHCSRQVAVATRNPLIRAQAQEAGIPSFATVARARRQMWAMKGKLLPGKFPEDGKRIPKAASPEQKRYFPALDHRRWWEWGAFAAACLLLFFLVVFLSSRAEIMVHPAVGVQSISLTFTGSPKVLSADLSGHLPVREITLILDQEGSGTSSGTIDFPEEFAQGEVRLINLRDDSIDVPAGLLLQTTGTPPVQFQTLDAITLSSGEESAQIVAVQAVEPGESGNVSAGSVQAVTGILGADLSVSNPEAISGGVTRTVLSPTQNDVDDLRQQLLVDLLPQAREAFAADLDIEHDWLVPTSVNMNEIISEEVTPNPGETADRFYLTLRVRYTAWMVSTSDLETTALQLLTASLDPGQTSIPGTLEITPSAEPRLVNGEVRWNLMLRQSIQPSIDPAFLHAFTGKPDALLADWMHDHGDPYGEVNIVHHPAWWFLLPAFPSRMQLVVQ